MKKKQIRKKLSIYLDKHDFDFPLLDDMVDFAQEVAKETAKELEQEHNKLLDVINGQDVTIADLEKQIEKMKCCENCKYNSYWGNELHCNYGLKEALQEDKFVKCHNSDKWELKE